MAGSKLVSQPRTKLWKERCKEMRGRGRDWLKTNNWWWWEREEMRWLRERRTVTSKKWGVCMRCVARVKKENEQIGEGESCLNPKKTAPKNSFFKKFVKSNWIAQIRITCKLCNSTPFDLRSKWVTFQVTEPTNLVGWEMLLRLSKIMNKREKESHAWTPRKGPQKKHFFVVKFSSIH